MAEVIVLLLIITVSLLLVRIGAVALERTGLATDAARFQSQSAFMGVGFTTAEAESVVNHPVRRKIIRLLMLLGFGAVTSTVGTVVLAFARPEEGGMAPEVKLAILAGALVALWIGFMIRPLDRLIDVTIKRALSHMTELRIVDYEQLLQLNKGYSVAAIRVEATDWMTGSTLRELGLAAEGVLVLSITRSNGFVLATPASTSEILPGDELLCYGLHGDLAHLRERSTGAAGDQQHEFAVKRQRLRLAEERIEDEIAEGEAEAPTESE